MRKARPLDRSTATYRDDRLILIACDDTVAPKQYFESFGFTRVRFYVEATIDGTSTPSAALSRLLALNFEPGDERWLVVDTDHLTHGSHTKSYKDAIRRATQHGVRIALSRPSFEVWLLLHYASRDEVRAIPDAKACTDRLGALIGGYKKSGLRTDLFALELVPRACREAELLDSSVPGSEFPQANTTRVYLIWKSIVTAMSPRQRAEDLPGWPDDLWPGA
jgi:hypothetical protein